MLHKLHTEKPMDFLAFRRHIATYYLQKFNKAPNPGRKSGKPSNYIPQYDCVMHYLVLQEKQTKCAECHQKPFQDVTNVMLGAFKMQHTVSHIKIIYIYLNNLIIYKF